MKNSTLKLSFKRTTHILLFMLAGMGMLRAEEFVTMDELFDEDIDQTAVEIRDPLESVNRVIFKFNDFLYLSVFDPVASGYQWITPDVAEKGLSNFFENLGYPVRLAGNLLQGKWEGAYVESGRFLLNSTFGVAGLGRPADKVEGFEAVPKEDLGQAFGTWGFGHGPYLMLPVLGPSSLRDLAGRLGDRAVNPFKVPFTVLDEWEIRTAYNLGVIISGSPALVQRYKQMKGGALDPYTALRNGYFQYRDAAVAK